MSGPPGKPWASRACAVAVLAVGGCLRRLINRGESTETWRQERVSAPLLFALLRTSQPRSLRKARSGHETSRGAFLGKHSSCCNRGSSEGGGGPENLPASNGRLERSPDVTARNRGGSSPRAPIQKEICGAAFPASHSPVERVSALTAACCSPEAAGPSRSRDPRVKQRSARSSGGRGVGLFCC